MATCHNISTWTRISAVQSRNFRDSSLELRRTAPALAGVVMSSSSFVYKLQCLCRNVVLGPLVLLIRLQNEGAIIVVLEFSVLLLR